MIIYDLLSFSSKYTLSQLFFHFCTGDLSSDALSVIMVAIQNQKYGSTLAAHASLLNFIYQRPIDKQHNLHSPVRTNYCFLAGPSRVLPFWCWWLATANRVMPVPAARVPKTPMAATPLFRGCSLHE